tara:strand:+ start:5331 stop:9626 length:4296 start_codon:yes stop_codon:yes gene_type:complete
MAGKFPLSYSTATTYGSATPNINPYYYIHNADNTSIYSEDGSAFDVYTFNETINDDSPQRSFSVILIKNIGAANSDLNISEITLSAEALSSAANWSLVEEVDDLSTSSAFGVNGCLTPSEYSTLLTGANNGNAAGVVMSSPAPILYLNINGVSGNVNKDSFGTGTEKYIPVFNPSDIVNASNSISCSEISSVVYPEYAAFMIECDPTATFTVIGSDVPETLTIGATGFSATIFHLNATGFSTGELAYTEGNSSSVSGDNFTFTALSVNQIKTFNTNSIDGVFEPYSENNIINPPTYLHDPSNSVQSSVAFTYMPYGLKNPTVIPNHNTSVLKVSDSSTNTGGVRYSHSFGILDVDSYYSVSAGKIPSSNTNAYINGSEQSTRFTYKVVKDTLPNIENVQGSAGTITAPFIMEENQNVFITIEKNDITYSDNNYNALHDKSHLLRPDGVDLSTAGELNFKPTAFNIPIYYQPFYVDGNSDETTTRDSISVFTGAYRPLSISSSTFQKYAAVSGDVNTNLSDLDSNFLTTSSVDSSIITQRIGGIVSGTTTDIKDVIDDSTNVRSVLGTATDNRNDAEGNYKVYKQNFVKDNFILPAIGNNSAEQNLNTPIDLRFSNLSGRQEFYANDFNWTSATDVVISVAAGVVFEDIKAIEFSNRTNFVPGSVTNGAGTILNSAVFNGSSDVGWSVYIGNQYISDSLYKDVKLNLKYQSSALEALSNGFPGKLDKLANIEDFQTGTAGVVDKLSRVRETTDVILRPVFLNVVKGTDLYPQQKADANFTSQEIRLSFHEYYLPTLTILNSISHDLTPAANTSIVGGTIHASQYAADFTTSTSPFSVNVSINTTTVPLTKFTDITVQNNTTTSGLSAGATGYEEQYLSIIRDKHRYYRKAPVSGSAQLLYENYLDYRKAHLSVTTDNVSGIRAKPEKKGRFDDSSRKEIASTSTSYHFTEPAQLNSAKGVYECFIPINFKNESTRNLQLIDVSLDNEIGDATNLTNGFADPRFVKGVGTYSINNTGNLQVYAGEKFDTSLRNTSVVGDCFPNNVQIRQVNADDTDATYLDLVSGNTTGLKIGMTVILPADDLDYVPRNATITELTSATRIKLSLAATASGDVYMGFTYTQPDYAIWNIVKGSRLPTVQGNALYPDIVKFQKNNALDRDVIMNSASSAPVGTTILVGNNTSGIFPCILAGSVADADGKNAAVDSTGYIATYETQGRQHLQDIIGSYVIGDAFLPGTKILSIGVGAANNITISHGTIATLAPTDVFKIIHPDAYTTASDLLGDTLGSDTGHSSTKIINSDLGNLPFGRSLYKNYVDDANKTLADTPHIYFAAKRTAVEDNDTDDVSFSNIVRFKYMVLDVLEFYNNHYQQFTNAGIGQPHYPEVSYAGTMSVYEDVYFVEANLINAQPDLQVSDIEGDLHDNFSVINFGTLSTG